MKETEKAIQELIQQRIDHLLTKTLLNQPPNIAASTSTVKEAHDLIKSDEYIKLFHNELYKLKSMETEPKIIVTTA